MQKTDNYNGRKRRSLRNKKWTIFWLLQPVLPDWSQLLVYQEFTRAFLCIYDKVLNKKWALKKLLFGVLQPVLPNWSQLLVYQEFTRIFLYIYDKMANKIWAPHFRAIFIFTPRFLRQVTILVNRCLPYRLIQVKIEKKNDSQVVILDAITRCTEQVTTLNLSVNYRGPSLYIQNGQINNGSSCGRLFLICQYFD